MGFVPEDAVDIDLDEVAIADDFGGVPLACGLFRAFQGAAQEAAFLELFEGGAAGGNHIAGCAGHKVDLGAAGPYGVYGFGVQEDAGVGGFAGPAPLEVEFVVFEGLVSNHIAEGLAGYGDDTVLGAKDLRGGHIAVRCKTEGPSVQILAVEKFCLALPAGEEAEKAQYEKGGQVAFQGIISLFLTALNIAIFRIFTL